jgi:hypothetical protein
MVIALHRTCFLQVQELNDAMAVNIVSAAQAKYHNKKSFDIVKRWYLHRCYYNAASIDHYHVPLKAQLRRTVRNSLDVARNFVHFLESKV